MNTDLKAQLKAAMWGLVAKYGAEEAKRIIRAVLSEIDQDDSWNRPGCR